MTQNFLSYIIIANDVLQQDPGYPGWTAVTREDCFYTRRFRDTRQLEKDYLLTLLPLEIYRVFDYTLIFKGGTSLKYFYKLNRFSGDLDFSYTGENSSGERGRINRKFENIMESIGRQYTINRMEQRGNSENGIVAGINFELRIKGPLYESSGEMQNIRIDICLRKDVLMES